MNPRELGAVWNGLNIQTVNDFIETTGAIEHYFYSEGGRELFAYLLCVPSISVHYGNVLALYYGINPSYRGRSYIAKAIMNKSREIAKGLGIEFISRSKHLTESHEMVITTKIK